MPSSGGKTIDGRMVQLGAVMSKSPASARPTRTAGQSVQATALGSAAAPALTAHASPATVLVPPLRLDHLAGHFMPLRPGRGFTRAESAYPIAPGPELADTLMFEHATDASKRYWLPRYRLRSTGGRYDIAFALESDGQWAVRFGLEAFPAPELGEAARSAEALLHTLDIAIRYRTPNANIDRRFVPTEIAPDARGHLVTLRLTLEERDGLLRAFKSDPAQAALVVLRRFDVAIPLPVEAPQPQPPRVIVRDHRTQAAVTAVPRAAVTGARFDADLAMRPGVEVVRPGPIDREPLPRPPRPPAPPPPAPPAPPVARFVRSAAALVCLVPLRFDSDAHPYLFPSGSTTAPATEFERVMLRHPADDPRGRMHAYFRDVARPNSFYFLPDALRLARTSEAPFHPAIVFRIEQGEGSEDAQVSMTCELRPSVDGKRLLAAAAAFEVHAGQMTHEFSFQPLPARSKLRLALPRSGVEKVVDVAEDVDLANGCLLEERFALDDFQDVFAALTTSTLSTLLRGNVAVSTGLAADDLVPVEISIAETEGELFVYAESADPATGAVSATLRNATESTLRIPSLPVWLKRGAQLVEGRIDAIEPALPAELARDAQLTLTINPVSALQGSEKTDAVFDTSAVRAIPDPKAILALTLDTSVVQEAEREITVLTRPELLAGDGPQNEVLMVVIEFRGNVQVTLDAATLKAEKVKVPIPLIDVLLPNPNTEGTYRVRQTVVYKQGGRTVKSDWRDDDSGVLVVPQA